ncbi:MAG: IS66 family insertion sequence element accessory protein TnpB [Clostridiaceae bacterium]|jgi:putative transposase|nr:IS66 family insertion sequence element accessory protein TnpB [Clostridiaceae bacterium]
MDTRKVATEYRLSKWAQVIQAQKESGKTVKDFCLDAGIKRNAFFYWQRKLRKLACTEFAKTEETNSIVPKGWMLLASKQEQQAKDTLAIEINGCHIRVNIDTDPELIKKVCRVLRSL